MLGVKKIYQALKVDLEDQYDSRRLKKRVFPKMFLTSMHKIIIFLKVQLWGIKGSTLRMSHLAYVKL